MRAKSFTQEECNRNCRKYFVNVIAPRWVFKTLRLFIKSLFATSAAAYNDDVIFVIDIPLTRGEAMILILIPAAMQLFFCLLFATKIIAVNTANLCIFTLTMWCYQ